MTEQIYSPVATMKFDSSKTFKDIIKLINEFKDEVVLEITQDKLRILEMDATRCAMILLEMPKEAFEEWDVTQEGKTCLNLDYLLEKSLKNVNAKNETVNLAFKLLGNKLKIGLDHEALKRSFTQDQLEIEEGYDEPPKPKIVYKGQAKVITKDVETILKDIEQHVTLTLTEDKLVFSEKTDSGDFSVPLKKGYRLLECETREGQIKAKYSNSYFESFIKKVKVLSEILTIEYATDMPLHLIAHVEHDIKIEFWIAPRIEVD